MTTAIELAREAEERREEIETLRDIPADLIQRAKSISLTKLWVAKKYNGLQKGVGEVMKTWEEMAYYNASLAWVCSVTNCSSLISGFLPETMAKDIFQKTDAMVGGFAGPAGMATPSKDGINVSGTWSWGSGIKHCTSIVGGVKLIRDDQMIGAGIVFFEPNEIAMIDNWNVLGLKGTHSIDYTIENLHIPIDRCIPFPPLKPIIDEPLYRFSFLGALSLSVAAVGLGLAKRALWEIKQLLREKIPLGQSKSLSKQAIIQERIGRIEGNFLSAKYLFFNIIQEAEEETQRGLASKEMKAKVRLASCKTTELCLSVVRDAYQIAGGNAVWVKNKFEELHRDIHIVSQHGMVAESNFRTAGSVILGNSVPELLL